MFSIRLVNADSYQAPPLPQLDPTFSEFRGSEIKHVPIIRVFGTTSTGKKACLHLHGVFPYLYVPYTGDEQPDRLAYRLAASLDTSINISLGSATSKSQHVYKIKLISGIPFYGYHKKQHKFFKISFYNPGIMKKAADLLQNGSVLNQSLQPHEAHIPYILQFMIDYNVHGMSFINLSSVKFRRNLKTESESGDGFSGESLDDVVEYLPADVERQSTCELEIDALISDILNPQELEKGVDLNPGLAAIWKEERARRAQAGLEGGDSQLVNPKSPERPAFRPTDDDLYQQQRLERRLQTISQSGIDETLSTSRNLTAYPLEIPDDNDDNYSLSSATSSVEGSQSRNSLLNCSVLDPEDLPLIEMLENLARESVDDDSILGTQGSAYSQQAIEDIHDPEEQEDPDVEEDITDLNLTCLELESLSSWGSIIKQKFPEASQPDLGELLADDSDDEKDTTLTIPQLDGAGDLSSNVLDSENNTRFTGGGQMSEKSKKKCLDDSLDIGHRKSVKMIGESEFSEPSWPINFTQQYSGDFEQIDEDFLDEFDNDMPMSVSLSSAEEAAIAGNSIIENNAISLDSVLNGDPCFTETADPDKSDFTELQDLLECCGLVGNVVAPEAYKITTSNSRIIIPETKENHQPVIFNKCSSLSENITPNIPEINAKVCNKNKFNQVVDESQPCRDILGPTIDNSDYNFNIVATWEELQDVKFLPSENSRTRCLNKWRNKVLTNRPINSAIKRKKKGPFKNNLSLGDCQSWKKIEGNILKEFIDDDAAAYKLKKEACDLSVDSGGGGGGDGGVEVSAGDEQGQQVIDDPRIPATTVDPRREMCKEEKQVQHFVSYYSSQRSHSSRQFELNSHRHCTYSSVRMNFIQDYVFTADQMWVIEKRKRGKATSNEPCTENCRLPIVLIKKLDIIFDKKVDNHIEENSKTENNLINNENQSKLSDNSTNILQNFHQSPVVIHRIFEEKVDDSVKKRSIILKLGDKKQIINSKKIQKKLRPEIWCRINKSKIDPSWLMPNELKAEKSVAIPADKTIQEVVSSSSEVQQYDNFVDLCDAIYKNDEMSNSIFEAEDEIPTTNQHSTTIDYITDSEFDKFNSAIVESNLYSRKDYTIDVVSQQMPLYLFEEDSREEESLLLEQEKKVKDIDRNSIVDSYENSSFKSFESEEFSDYNDNDIMLVDDPVSRFIQQSEASCSPPRTPTPDDLSTSRCDCNCTGYDIRKFDKMLAKSIVLIIGENDGKQLSELDTGCRIIIEDIGLSDNQDSSVEYNHNKIDDAKNIKNNFSIENINKNCLLNNQEALELDDTSEVNEEPANVPTMPERNFENIAQILVNKEEEKQVNLQIITENSVELDINVNSTVEGPCDGELNEIQVKSFETNEINGNFLIKSYSKEEDNCKVIVDVVTLSEPEKPQDVVDNEKDTELLLLNQNVDADNPDFLFSKKLEDVVIDENETQIIVEDFKKLEVSGDEIKVASVIPDDKLISIELKDNNCENKVDFVETEETEQVNIEKPLLIPEESSQDNCLIRNLDKNLSIIIEKDKEEIEINSLQEEEKDKKIEIIDLYKETDDKDQDDCDKLKLDIIVEKLDQDCPDDNNSSVEKQLKNKINIRDLSIKLERINLDKIYKNLKVNINNAPVLSNIKKNVRFADEVLILESNERVPLVDFEEKFDEEEEFVREELFELMPDNSSVEPIENQESPLAMCSKIVSNDAGETIVIDDSDDDCQIIDVDELNIVKSPELNFDVDIRKKAKKRSKTQEEKETLSEDKLSLDDVEDCCRPKNEKYPKLVDKVSVELEKKNHHVSEARISISEQETDTHNEWLTVGKTPRNECCLINKQKNETESVGTSVECVKPMFHFKNKLKSDKIGCFSKTYRRVTAHRDKLHTLSIDERLVLSQLIINDVKLCKKTTKEKFFVNIGLYPLKLRCCGWNPEVSKTAFIQLQEPQVMLQRLTPAVLKHYGYTRRFKSNRFGKRFKNFKTDFTIPSLDGTADLSSSEEEDEDIDKTLETEEKKVCVYSPGRNKRKRKENDDDKYSPKKRISQSSSSSIGSMRNYTPLKIFIKSSENRTSSLGGREKKRMDGDFLRRRTLIAAEQKKDVVKEKLEQLDTIKVIQEEKEKIVSSDDEKNTTLTFDTDTENSNDKNASSSDSNESDDDVITFTQYLQSNSSLRQSYTQNLPQPSSSNESITITPKIHPPTVERINKTMEKYKIPTTKNPHVFFSKQSDTLGQKKLAQQVLKVAGKGVTDLPVFKSRLKNITGINRWRKMKLNELCLSGVQKNNSPTVITPLMMPPSRKRVEKWLKTQDYLEKKNNKKIEENSQQSFHEEDKSSLEASSSDTTVDASLQSILDNSRLFKKTDGSNLGISYGQIEYQSVSSRSNITNENMNNARALTTYDHITTLCVEVHVNTRGDLLPDPQHDAITSIFYCVKNDVPPESSILQLEHGVIVIAPSGQFKFAYDYGSSMPFNVYYAANEEELFEAFISLVLRTDPELFIGWEIESLSWGYIFQRAGKLNLNLAKRISRIPGVQCKWESSEQGSESLAEVKLPGRIVLDIWRIMRPEIALLTYTFENVMYHVMNERIPCPSFRALTNWWQKENSSARWKVVQHYCFKVVGVLRILEQLDIIGRMSEHARLFGIQFYEVFSRGSQYRVESIMLRLAKPLNYIAVSPSSHQRACMRAMEALPLIMEPESMLYTDPLIVLDFQSLYPSIIIAHNICFSTCLGRIEHIGQPDPFEFGASYLRVNKKTAINLRGKVNYIPCGVAFVKPEIRLGILPRMLTEILETRFMVKKAMKDHAQDNKTLHRVLHSRQHGLKYLANVTYGYTAANFSGRMPCIEVGDSVISKSKETLERAIKLVESTPKWGARVVYGDTDSLFILVPGKSKDDAFKIGYEIADAVTASNPSPIKLKFEKILYPAILQTKKRYCGYMWEQPDQVTPKYLAKGIETVRRDGCPAVSKILEKSLKILFDSKDISQVKQYVTRQIDKILRGKVSLQDLTFAKEFRGLRGYKEKACVPALELTRRLMKKDPRAVPRHGERVRYVIVAGAPNQALIHCVRSPWEVLDDPGLRPNAIYYITRVIIPPLNRCFNLMGVEVNNWFKEMPHRQVIENPSVLPTDKQKQTIFQYFGNVICVICETSSSKCICNSCSEKPTETLIILHEKLRWLDRINHHVQAICQSCCGQCQQVECISLDCPVIYRRIQADKDYQQANETMKLIQDKSALEF